MPTLEEILKFIKSKDIFKGHFERFLKGQFKLFETFIESDDELNAWQTVLGNIAWLRKEGLEIDQTFLEEKAQGIGKTWFPNEQLCTSYTYKNGVPDGIFEGLYGNGHLYFSGNYKEGNLDGLYQKWYSNGQLSYSCSYKEGKKIK